jgi:MinD-like ATPase involved in chromosome partitioning or flagellar assembly
VLGERVGVLVAAGGARWEVEALKAVAGGQAGAVLLKRCVDLPDLLATAATGQARVALVSAALPGLDADSVAHLRRAGVGVLVVAEPTDRVVELPGVFEVLAAETVGTTLGGVLPAAATSAADGDTSSDGGAVTPSMDVHAAPAPAEVAAPSGPESPGRVVVVWGPTGAPGRTTVAVGVAAELASRGHDVLLVDADGYGGAVAQHLGMLEEVSGLLSAVRLANAGQLDAVRLASLARSVGPGLRVLTGLPRADRWVEVREVAFEALLDAAKALCPYVVLDLGFNLEQTEQAFGSGAPQRNQMTVTALDRADEVLVVGSADPVGLARLARGLVELLEVAPVAAVRVVVNRVRPSLGWGEQEVRAMVEGFVTPASMHFLPDDPATVDRALMTGRPLVELGDSALRSALAGLADGVDLDAQPGAGRSRARRPGRPRGRLRRRRADRGR